MRSNEYIDAPSIYIGPERVCKVEAVVSIFVQSLLFPSIGDAHDMHSLEGFGATGALPEAGTTTSH